MKHAYVRHQMHPCMQKRIKDLKRVDLGEGDSCMKEESQFKIECSLSPRGARVDYALSSARIILV